MRQQRSARLLPLWIAASALAVLTFDVSAFLPSHAGRSARVQGTPVAESHCRRAVAAALLAGVAVDFDEAACAEEKWETLRPIQYIAALGDPKASSGTGAQDWGIWRKDPGPRGVDLDRIGRVQQSRSGKAPAGWKFDPADWYVEEHGLIMEKPRGGDGGSGEPLKPGKYFVTGAREVKTILTVFPPDEKGDQRWELQEGKLFDVTHLPCRTGRYTGAGCTPANARKSDFPVSPGAAMPAVEGCNKQDYAVLFVLRIAA
eukprot:TRINITY_DN78943_c0_g1_i1.p1 TRINITY_DN78943_c0_g1~~TRINITY_DN78943_c0_g1_i1.p1  ORF type:complete len:272 (-),score=58.79 TRINITY_DN78943_c0_g1_i1:37-813(-)